MDKHRNERLAQTLRDELDEILNYELEDPRIDAVRVTEVLLSSDAKRAAVLLAPLEGNSDFDSTLAAVDRARNHIRYILMERLELYRMPDLQFEPASGAGIQPKVRQLLRRMRRGRPRDGDSTEETKNS